MKIELLKDSLPCPFCGGDQSYLGKVLREGYEASKNDPDAHAFTVVCCSCAAESGWSKSQTGAVKNWNMRHNIALHPTADGGG